MPNKRQKKAARTAARQSRRQRGQDPEEIEVPVRVANEPLARVPVLNRGQDEGQKEKSTGARSTGSGGTNVTSRSQATSALLRRREAEIVMLRELAEVEERAEALRHQLNQPEEFGENESQKLSDDEPEDGTNPNERMEDWLNVPNPSTTQKKDSSGKNSKCNLTNELPNSDVVVLPIENPDDSNPEKAEQPALTIMEQMMKAITALATNQTAVPVKEDHMKRFVARQTTAKDLPVFFGDPEEWPSFISEYRGTTQDCEFSDRENMARLRKCLKGKAKEAVQSLMVVPENIDKVISTLEVSFGRPDLIIETLIVKARKIYNPRDDKPETMIDFSNAVNNLVSTVENLKKPSYLYNPSLTKELVGKLTPMAKERWGHKIVQMTEEYTLKTLAVWLKTEARVASLISAPIVESYGTPRETERKFDRRNRNSQGRKGQAVYATQHGESEKNTSADKCSFCSKGGHEISVCRNFKKLDMQKRWTWATENRACFGCLQTGHRYEQCERKTNCSIENCNKPHHELLHRTFDRREEPKEGKDVVCHTTKRSIASLENNVLLRIAPVTLKGPKGDVQTYALFDDASTLTLLHSSLAKKIGANGPTNNLEMTWINGVPYKGQNSRRVKIGVCGPDGKTYTMNNVHSVNTLELPVQTVNVKKLAERWKYLNQVKTEDLKFAKPMILIGQDNQHLTVAREIIEGPPNAPMMTKTKLGWVVHGSNGTNRGRVDCNFTFHVWHKNGMDELHQLVKQNFAMDAVGVRDNQKKPKSRDDIRAEQVIAETTRRVGERFETGLLWRREDIVLPESRNNAMTRLKSMERKMDRNEEFKLQYCNKIDEYVEKGYARMLSPEEAAHENPRNWYLPHFGVLNPNKPGKLRFVFDAAAKSRGTSLNDNLLKGPDRLNSLIGVLLNFRRRRIAFCGDVQEMFHQVLTRSEDQNSQRFLWRGNDRVREPDVYVMQVMTFGATCSPCLAQEVKNLNAKDFQEESPTAAEAIIENHYVDDYLDGTDTEKEAVGLIGEVIRIQRQCGFVLRNWMCSSRSVLQHLPPDLRCEKEKNLSMDDEMPTERVLGLMWNPNADNFTFNCQFHKIPREILDGRKLPTKREVLRVNASMYDPFGYLAHFMIKAKIVMQDIWRTEIGWDDEIPQEIFTKWKIWLEEVKKVPDIEIRRCISQNLARAENVQLHVFCDASEQAMATVGYLRVKSGDEIEVGIVMARTRVASLKTEFTFTMPRKELNAAVMGSRLAEAITSKWKDRINEIHFWSDSMTVLRWIRAESKKNKAYEAFRLGEIEETTEVNSWHWVPTKENVADDATRDIFPSDMTSGSRWLQGPAFLKLPPEEWPKETNIRGEEDEEVDEQTTSDFVCVVTKNMSILPETIRFSSWLRLVRSTAWMLRFIENCSSRRLKVKRKMTELTPEEIRKAAILCCKEAQMEAFAGDIAQLKKTGCVLKSSRIYTLTPMLDQNGLLRLTGRTGKSPELSEQTKHPLILDPASRFTELMIQYFHANNGHGGVETVVNELRQRYWILGIRNAVKKATRLCQVCKIARARPIPPEMGMIPKCRLTQQIRPFIETGVDYFGPLEVTVRRSREKRYGVLFTCMTTRAVHLEIAGSLTTDSAISAIRRFIGRRGKPKRMHSDNGTNFVGAEREMKLALAEWNQEKITAELANEGIEWFFIPPSAPHMGGCWERMVKSVKTALKAILKEQAPKEETLHTLLVEAESIVNSHPLTHVSVDPKDLESLTPNHFLIGTSNGNPPPGEFGTTDLYRRKEWRKAQALADSFWKRWVKEYLPSLTKRTKWHSPAAPVKIGDCVLIADGDHQRNHWPRGRVVAVYPGTDGVTRAVDVKTATKTLRRPMVKVCILDVEGVNIDDSTEKEVEKAGASPLGRACRRLSRAGATKNNATMRRERLPGETGQYNLRSSKRSTHSGAEEKVSSKQLVNCI